MWSHVGDAAQQQSSVETYLDSGVDRPDRLRRRNGCYSVPWLGSTNESGSRVMHWSGRDALLVYVIAFDKQRDYSGSKLDSRVRHAMRVTSPCELMERAIPRSVLAGQRNSLPPDIRRIASITVRGDSCLGRWRSAAAARPRIGFRRPVHTDVTFANSATRE